MSSSVVAPPYLTPDYLAAIDAAAQAPTPGGNGAPPKRSSRFRFLTLEEAEAIPKPAWLVDEMLPVGASVELYGPPGAGKSFVAIDLAMSVASGRPFLGHATKHSTVAYCLGESVGGVGARLRAWRQARGATFGVRFRLLPGMVQLLDAGDVTAFLAAIGEQLDEQPGLIVIDTLARSIVGGDENSARDMGVAADALDRVRQATGACAVVLHHTGKSGESERGSGAIRGAFETMIELKNDGGSLSLRCDKQRDGEEFPSIAFVLAKQGDSLVVQRPGAVPARKGPSKPALELLLVLARDFSVENPTSGQWRDASPKQFSVKGSFNRWQNELVLAHLVAVDKSDRWPRFAVTPDGHQALAEAGLSPSSHSSSHGLGSAEFGPDGWGPSHVSETTPPVRDGDSSPEAVSSSPSSHASHRDDETETPAELWDAIREREAERDGIQNEGG